jgi:hypothetical protein
VCSCLCELALFSAFVKTRLPPLIPVPPQHTGNRKAPDYSRSDMRVVAQHAASPGRHTQHSPSQAQYAAAHQSMACSALIRARLGHTGQPRRQGTCAYDVQLAQLEGTPCLRHFHYRGRHRELRFSCGGSQGAGGGFRSKSICSRNRASQAASSGTNS